MLYFVSFGRLACVAFALAYASLQARHFFVQRKMRKTSRSFARYFPIKPAKD